MDRSARDLMAGVAVLRTAIGLGVALAPRRTAQVLVGDAAHEAVFITRLFASREIALGVLTLDALRRDDHPGLVVALNGFVDALDGVAAAAGRRLRPVPRWLTIAGATAAVAVAVCTRRTGVK